MKYMKSVPIYICNCFFNLGGKVCFIVYIVQMYHHKSWVGLFVSSPEHEVLMVSYCGQWLSVVRRRPSSVVCQHLMFTL